MREGALVELPEVGTFEVNDTRYQQFAQTDNAFLGKAGLSWPAVHQALQNHFKDFDMTESVSLLLVRGLSHEEEAVEFGISPTKPDEAVAEPVGEFQEDGYANFV